MKYRLTLIPPESISFDFDSSIISTDLNSGTSVHAFGKDVVLSFPEVLHYAELLGITNIHVQTFIDDEE